MFSYLLVWAIQEDGSLIMGAPGSYLWKGAGFVFDGTNERIPVTTDSGSSFGYIGMGVTQARIRSPSILGVYILYVVPYKFIEMVELYSCMQNSLDL